MVLEDSPNHTPPTQHDKHRLHVRVNPYAWPCRRDDLTRTQLRAQLAEMRPCELVLPSSPLSEATRKVLKAALRSPRTSRYSTAERAASIVEMLEEKGYFVQWPEVLTVGSGLLPESLGNQMSVSSHTA